MGEETLAFGLSRQHAGLHLDEAATAFCAALGRRLGIVVEAKILDDYARLLDALLDSQVALGWLPPFMLACAGVRGAEVAALCERRGRLVYRSTLVVHVDSPIRDLPSLRGARAAWTNASSAAGYVVPRAYLREAGVDPDDLALEQFYGSNAAACGAVFAGDADVAACFVSDAATSDPALVQRELETTLGSPMGSRLRAIGVTPAIPADGIALAPTLPAPTRVQLRQTLLELHGAEGGKAAIAALMQADRLAPATDEVMRMFARLSSLATGGDDDETVA
jgi:phosphonate transport system substrate-binding protein